MAQPGAKLQSKYLFSWWYFATDCDLLSNQIIQIQKAYRYDFESQSFLNNFPWIINFYGMDPSDNMIC